MFWTSFCVSYTLVISKVCGRQRSLESDSDWKGLSEDLENYLLSPLPQTLIFLF